MYKELNTEDLSRKYASLGYPILPLHSIVNGYCTCGGRPACRPGKHPITSHGFRDATTSLNQITCWLRDYPYANIGIATGGKCFVVESDPRHDGDKTLADLLSKHGPLPETPRARSGGGGEHYYFAYPKGKLIKSKAGIAPGIDVRGEAGYCVVPPSLHASGNRYEWLVDLEHPLAEAPDWLLSLVCESNKAKPTGMVLVMGSGDVEDLSTHPGESEGTRNQTLIRLLGIHISRGDSPATIEALAMRWADRCRPPYPEDRVRQALRWAEGKRVESVDSIGGKGNDPEHLNSSQPLARSDANEPDTTNPPTLSQPDPEPEQPDAYPLLHADAYQGLAGQIVQAIAPETEADPVGILLTLLACFGNAIGNRPHFAVGADCHHSNLFACLVGDTASGKGQAWSIAKHLMRKADPEWCDAVGYGLSSGEGLVERVSDPDSSQGPSCTMLAYPTVKRLLCLETEFAKPITAMRREGNTLSPLLRSAWDSQTLEIMTRGKSKTRASNAHISIVAHITPEELGKLLGGSVEVANGFANRFLWCLVRRSRLLPHGGDASVLDAYVQPLRDAIEHAKGVDRVRRHAEADRLWEEIYGDLAESRPGAYGRATERARPQVMRLALLYALLDRSVEIRVEHLRAAKALWGYCQGSAGAIFGGKSGDSVGGLRGQPEPLDVRLLSIICREPGISRKGLHAATHNRVKATDMDEALASLESRRLAYRGRCRGEGPGRPPECWFPGVPRDDDGLGDEIPQRLRWANELIDGKGSDQIISSQEIVRGGEDNPNPPTLSEQQAPTIAEPTKPLPDWIKRKKEDGGGELEEELWRLLTHENHNR